MEKKAFLIGFTYDHYCQGWDMDEYAQELVYAVSFEDACTKIRNSGIKYGTKIFEGSQLGGNARDFVNKTI